MSSKEIHIEYPLKVPKYTKAHIDYLIRSRAEESIHIEFKAGPALDWTDSRKKEIAKDVSAFANSDGGIIIYGLSEENNAASGYSFVDRNEFSKEWLEQVINSKIKRRIPDLEIDVIRVGNKISQSVYVVRIPRSSESPHMASDGRFYKRFNFESVRMEEYEVRDLFRRMDETQLKLLPAEFTGAIDSVTRDQNVKVFRLSVILDVKNTSRTIEQTYKTILRIPRSVYDNSHAEGLSPFFRKYQRDYALLNVPGTTPLFPQEVNTLVRFDLLISGNHLADLATFPMKIRFYYSNGIYELQYFLDTKMKIDGKLYGVADFAR